MKYIIYEDEGNVTEVMIFSDNVIHKVVAEGCSERKPVSAGFFNYFIGKVSCYGDSSSLELKSRGPIDAELVYNKLVREGVL